MKTIHQTLVILVSAAFTVMYFIAALPRLLYPYDLDFLEDSVLMESLQVANQQPVYIAPNADFNPHVYMPLFFLLGGILFKLGGPSLSLLRFAETIFSLESLTKRDAAASNMLDCFGFTQSALPTLIFEARDCAQSQ